jgi:hypothetical protein
LAQREVRLGQAIIGFWRNLRATSAPSSESEPIDDLPIRVADSLRRYEGRVLLILSGADLTAQEFDTAVLRKSAMKTWQTDPRVTVQRLERANHTYSRRPWRDQVHGWTEAWLRDLP